MNEISSGCYVIDSEYNLIEMNDTAQSLYPQLELGKKCYQCLMGLDSPCGPCPVANGVKGPQVYRDPIRDIVEMVDAVELRQGENGPHYALIFSTVGMNAEIAATLPVSEDELKNLGLVTTLANEYFSDLFTVRVSDGSLSLLRQAGKSLEKNNDAQERFYEQENEQYISKYVLEEDKEELRRVSALPNILAALREKNPLTHRYRVLLNGEVHYYYRKIATIGKGENPEHIIIGVGCEDEAVEQKAKYEALENRLGTIEASSLTGLFTREAFFVRGKELLEENPEKSYDFCIMRLENLGLINHQFSNYAGDEVLQLIGRELKRYADSTNCIAYMGDGVFASVTENISEAKRKADIAQLEQSVRESCSIKSLDMKWSLYVDIQREFSVKEIYENAAYALSTIRSEVGRSYVEFDHDMVRRMAQEIAVRNSFKNALEEQEFVPYFQPKYSVQTGRIIGAEALIRWKKNDGGIIPPAEFIPILERYGMIALLDKYVLKCVCEKLKELEAQGIPMLPISVNLSRASLFTENLVQDYTAIVKEHALEPQLTPIEITESVAVRALEITDFIREFTNNGFVFHMDDFGAGYSSLASLQIIPIEAIKLDKSLVDFIGQSSGENLLRHTIAYARESGKSVVAEGVETPEQLAFLKEHECDFAQGYLFSKPLPWNDFINALKEQGYGD